MMDWTEGIGLAVYDQPLMKSLYREVAPMLHLIFRSFFHEIGVATLSGGYLPTGGVLSTS